MTMNLSMKIQRKFQAKHSFTVEAHEFLSGLERSKHNAYEIAISVHSKQLS